jgi:hypothetical protein
MAVRSIDLLAYPGQPDIAKATYDALARMPRNWKRITVPGSSPFPGLHPRSKTPIVSLPALLTNTSKMPCPSWGLPAGKACPGAKYGEGSICGSCYAAKGNYGVPTVQWALSERFRWTLACMRTEAGRDAFVAYMSAAIDRIGLPYFRVHDSGDLFSPAYARCWARIARNLSHIRFWFPTRSYRIPNLLPAIQELAGLPNVTVRPSALMLDSEAPVIDGLAAGSGATYSKDDATCPAYTQEGKCLDCRSCWDRPDRPVLYPLH